MPKRNAHTNSLLGQPSAHLRRTHGNNQACLSGTEIRAMRKNGLSHREDNLVGHTPVASRRSQYTS